MLEYLLMGLLLGLSAGLAPGPMLSLIISETLRHGLGAGIRVSLAPLFSDIPIILLAVLVLSQLGEFEFILGTLALLGGALIFYMGMENLKTRPADLQTGPTGEARSLTRGILTNLLNPNPYWFWFGVGVPTMSEASKVNISGAIAFVACFYLLLIGSKMLLAVIAARSKALLTGQWYRYTMQFLGLSLCVLAILLVMDGLMLMDLI